MTINKDDSDIFLFYKSFNPFPQALPIVQIRLIASTHN